MADPLSQGALIRDDKRPYIINKHPWTKGSGHTRLDRHHHWQSQQSIKLLRQFLGVFTMQALIKRITPCAERGIWFMFGLFKRSLGHGPVSPESSPQSSPVQSPGFVKAH